MIKNYLVAAVRNLLRHKTFSFINLTGLAVGMACCIVIAVFVRGELIYDNYHVQKERVFRLALKVGLISSGKEERSAVSPVPWAPSMKREYPEVQEYVRFISASSPEIPWEIRYGEKKFAEASGLYADASVFNVFTWPLMQGDPGTALTQPNTMVLSQALADKYFGAESPIGKTLTVAKKQRDEAGNLISVTRAFFVTGVMKNIPANSHFTCDFLVSILNLNEEVGGDVTSGEKLDRWFWRGRIAHTYLRLSSGKEAAALEAKFPKMVDRYVGDDTRSRGYYYAPFLQPLRNIYLDGDYGYLGRPFHADQAAAVTYVVSFLAVGLFAG